MFGCSLTLTIEIKSTPFLLHPTKMPNKINNRRHLSILCHFRGTGLKCNDFFHFFWCKCLKTDIRHDASRFSSDLPGTC